MQTDLTISLINHSNPELLRDCLRSLYVATNAITFDIWVVDNATDRRLVPEIQAEFPQVRWLFNAERKGFSANHNQVLRQAEGRYVCILNDDTIIHERALDSLIACMDADPQIGLSGPRLLNADGTIQDSAFRFWTLGMELITISILPGKLSSLKGRVIDPVQEKECLSEVDWLLGACLVMRAEVLAQVGLLDDVLSPVVYMEEVDWCRRVHQFGAKVAYCPAARITHFGGQSTTTHVSQSDAMRVELHRTHIAYFRKHYGLLQATLLRLIYTLMLPWNTVMLLSSLARGRISCQKYKRDWNTFAHIALAAWLPRSLR